MRSQRSLTSGTKSADESAAEYARPDKYPFWSETTAIMTSDFDHGWYLKFVDRVTMKFGLPKKETLHTNAYAAFAGEYAVDRYEEALNENNKPLTLTELINEAKIWTPQNILRFYTDYLMNKTASQENVIAVDDMLKETPKQLRDSLYCLLQDAILFRAKLNSLQPIYTEDKKTINEIIFIANRIAIQNQKRGIRLDTLSLFSEIDRHFMALHDHSLLDNIEDQLYSLLDNIKDLLSPDISKELIRKNCLDIIKSKHELFLKKHLQHTAKVPTLAPELNYNDHEAISSMLKTFDENVETIRDQLTSDGKRESYKKGLLDITRDENGKISIKKPRPKSEVITSVAAPLELASAPLELVSSSVPAPVLPAPKPKKPSFFQRHPILKKALIGFAIGLLATVAVAAICGIIYATGGTGAFAIAAVVTNVVAKVGLAGAIASVFAPAVAFGMCGAGVGACDSTNGTEMKTIPKSIPCSDKAIGQVLGHTAETQISQAAAPTQVRSLSSSDEEANATKPLLPASQVVQTLGTESASILRVSQR